MASTHGIPSGSGLVSGGLDRTVFPGHAPSYWSHVLQVFHQQITIPHRPFVASFLLNKVIFCRLESSAFFHGSRVN
jgi:hypothetical protein